MGNSWGGKGEPPKWNETKVYCTVLVCIGIIIVIIGLKEGWL